MLFGKRKRLVSRILLVEDEPLVAFDNETSMRELGYEIVATVDRFMDAAAILDAQDVDLVLTDVSLAGERTGIDVARYAAGKGVPVLFVSGTCPADAGACAIGCLAKPYNERALKNALQAVDRKIGGGNPGKLPPGLIFYAEPEGQG